MLTLLAGLSLLWAPLVLTGPIERNSIPAVFEMNQAQWNQRVQARVTIKGSSINFLSDGGVVGPNGIAIRLRGAMDKTGWVGLNPLPGVSNFLVGNRKQWRTGVQHYSPVNRGVRRTVWRTPDLSSTAP